MQHPLRSYRRDFALIITGCRFRLLKCREKSLQALRKGCVDIIDLSYIQRQEKEVSKDAFNPEDGDLEVEPTRAGIQEAVPSGCKFGH